MSNITTISHELVLPEYFVDLIKTFDTSISAMTWFFAVVIPIYLATKLIITATK